MALQPALVPDKTSRITYVDGHMIAYWSRTSMHKGKITSWVAYGGFARCYRR